MVESTNALTLLDDVFSDSPPASPAHTGSQTLQSSEPSDIPRLRTTHTTAGYRDGIASSKTASLQPGFDEGYSLGAVIGLRVGHMLGVIDGICHALHGVEDVEGNRIQALQISRQARRELDVRNIFGRDVWDAGGTWKYEVRGGTGEEDVTFEEVADAHPLLAKWRIRVENLMQRLGIREKPFEGEEWEKGRISNERDTH